MVAKVGHYLHIFLADCNNCELVDTTSGNVDDLALERKRMVLVETSSSMDVPSTQPTITVDEQSWNTGQKCKKDLQDIVWAKRDGSPTCVSQFQPCYRVSGKEYPKSTHESLQSENMDRQRTLMSSQIKKNRLGMKQPPIVK